MPFSDDDFIGFRFVVSLVTIHVLVQCIWCRFPFSSIYLVLIPIFLIFLVFFDASHIDYFEIYQALLTILTC